MIRDAITKLLLHQDLSREESGGVMAQIMDGEATPAQIAAYLVALRCKGETVGELVGSVCCMRERAVPVDIGDLDAVDLCGTGGDGKSTFNISTTSAFVVAGAGVKVAKHGNRAASSNCGSADLLEQLGVAISLRPEHVSRCIHETGLGFMFAPLFHPAMKNVAAVRKELGVRTIFNVLGPLANPAGVGRQLIGVFDGSMLEDMAHTLHGLGTASAIIVHGKAGYDEATTTSENDVATLRSGEVSTFTFEPEEFGFEKAEPEALRGGSYDENASITLRILDGESGPRTDTVLLNSGLALVAAGRTEDLSDGISMARESVKSGKAAQALRGLIRISQALSKEDS